VRLCRSPPLFFVTDRPADEERVRLITPQTRHLMDMRGDMAVHESARVGRGVRAIDLSVIVPI